MDDGALFMSTTFAESAHVAETFTKAIPTGGSPSSLRLVFDLQATPLSTVDATLAVAIGNRVEWSGTPVAGTRTVDVDVSGDVALQATGSFLLVFSLQLNRTGWEEPPMTALIDNVGLVIPGTLARIAVTATTASVLVGQTAVFTAGGRGTGGQPGSLPRAKQVSPLRPILSAHHNPPTLPAAAPPGAGVVA